MKTTALILGILSLFTFSSCKCDFDEDEAENKYDKEKTVSNGRYTNSIAQNDTLRVK
ncbi:hypothetical protein [Chryseobacterium sp. Leaf201]|jgi:hypothetical protein|uniref:hypothetical protein n=1 Tax=Chryseobacterium sp. Leaf201 TaxID=1735672 RepID=UPI000A71427F|nr:hypothetical protein [Chryseobacterium sp. Leaf201]